MALQVPGQWPSKYLLRRCPLAPLPSAPLHPCAAALLRRCEYADEGAASAADRRGVVVQIHFLANTACFETKVYTSRMLFFLNNYCI